MARVWLAVLVAVSCSFIPLLRAQCNKTAEVTALTVVSKSLTSPNYPGPYPRNASCSWLVATSFGPYVVELMPMVVNLETSPDCQKDSLKIYDGRDDKSVVLAKLCSYSPRTYVSSGNYMYIRLSSDNEVELSGFYFWYQAVLPDFVVTSTTLEPPQGEPSGQDTVRLVMTGIGVFAIFIMILAVLVACSRSHLRRQSESDETAGRNPHDVDNPNYTTVGLTGLPARDVTPDNGEFNLPPNYSDLSLRNGVERSVSADGEGRGQRQYSRQDSQPSSPPPRYANFMIELFPPKTPPLTRHESISPSSSPYLENARSVFTREDSIPPPSSPYPENKPSFFIREDSIGPPSSPYPENTQFTREDSIPPPSSPYPENTQFTREDSMHPLSSPQSENTAVVVVRL